MSKLSMSSGASLAAALALVGSSAPGVAQRQMVVRLLDAPSASTAHVLATPAALRELADGSVLVNDTERRQLLALSSNLGTLRVIADSVGGLENSYGPRPGGIIPFTADSTLFIDPVGLSMFVIGPTGTIARVASIPRSQDASQLATNAVSVDRAGRLVYRGPLRLPNMAFTGVTSGATPDSTDIDRFDLKTRRLDTAGYFRTFKVSVSATQTEKGISATAVVNPLQMVDDWAVLSDGTIAIVRGLDYHVDFIGADGATRRGAKIPFVWQPLTDERKVSIIDSVRASMSRPPAPGQPGPLMSGHAMQMSHGEGGANMPMTMALPPASELPDYYPAFEQNAARADADGNLWIRTTATRDGAIGGPIYDVIDHTGSLKDRIQLPPGRRLAGFGRGGIVYLAARDNAGAWLERTRRQFAAAASDSTVAKFTGVWEGSFTSDHASGGMRVEFAHDTAWAIDMNIVLEQPIRTRGTSIAIEGNRASWNEEIMGLPCRTTSALEAGSLKGQIDCGHVQVAFELKRRPGG